MNLKLYKTSTYENTKPFAQPKVKSLFEKTKPISKGPVMNLSLYLTSTYENTKPFAQPKAKSLFEKTNPICEKVKCA